MTAESSDPGFLQPVSPAAWPRGNFDTAPEFSAGDILACWGADPLSRLISLATARPIRPAGLRFGPSHVGLIVQFDHWHEREPRLFESTSLATRPCLWARHHVSGVQLQDPLARVNDYVAAGGRVDVYRMVPVVRARFFRDGDHQYLAEICQDFLERRVRYDKVGAVISATRLLKWTSLVVPGEAFFCSEVIARVLQLLGLMDWLNPTAFNPASLLRRLVARQGIYARVARYDRSNPPASEPVEVRAAA